MLARVGGCRRAESRRRTRRHKRALSFAERARFLFHPRRKAPETMARILVFDTTLRDGEQSPGATLSPGEKLRIAHELDALGVDVIEAGFPDGAPADTLTLYGPDDIRLRRAQIDEGTAPMERKEAEHKRLNALMGLAEAKHCRRQTLLAYFAEELAQPCGNCDLCADRPVLFDATEAARKAFSAILRTGESFGAEHLIGILRGDSTEKIARRGHDRLPTFGVGQEYTRPQWQTIFRQLMGLDLIRPDPSRHGALRLTEAARPLLRGETTLELREDTVARAARDPGRSAPVALVAEEDEGLLSALKAKRRELAEAAGAPAYVIFPDRTLIEMATQRPRTLDALRGISGVGATKLERYGATFLAVINGEAPEPLHPARRRLAGRPEGSLFDRLQAAHVALARGLNGTAKPLDCTSLTLAKIAESRPRTLAELERIPGMGPQKAERFGEAFLRILHDEDADESAA